MMKVTDSFWFHEFAPHGADQSWLPQNKIMQLMIKHLAENLQILRSHFENSLFKISSGVRTLIDYQRLKISGYNPSVTSDHYFGQAIPLEPKTDKYNKFGAFYNFGVGAADIIPVGVSAAWLFKTAVQFDLEKKVNFGQIIYENNPANGSEWVHFGNDPNLFFQSDVCDFICKRKYLTSNDNGKTYSVAG